MAKDADQSSTPLIWLNAALELARTALGSEAGAKLKLTEWLASGALPWGCTVFEGLSAERFAELEQERQTPMKIQRLPRRGLLEADHVVLSGNVMRTPTIAYFAGDCRFWGDPNLEIDWADNSAREVITFGARAWGVRISQQHLDALLSGATPNSDETPAPVEMPTHTETHSAKVWVTAELEDMKKAGILPGIKITKLSRDLEKRMLVAAARDKSLRPLKARSIENRLRDWGLWPISAE